MYLESKEGFLIAGEGEVINGKARYIVEYFNKGGNVIEGDSVILLNEGEGGDLSDDDEDFVHMNINQIVTDVFVGDLVEFLQVLSFFGTFIKPVRFSRNCPGNDLWVYDSKRI